MKNVMVDLETLGTQSNAVIISIGAVEFDETSLGTKFYTVVDAQSCVDVGMEMLASTVMFWMQQEAKAREAFNTKGMPLVEALKEFTLWYPKDAALWGNGATFDNVILSTAFRYAKLHQPWKYKDDRCYRTLRAMYPSIKAERVGGVYHNALDDAIYQAQHAVKILQHINGINPVGELRKLT